MGKIIQLQVLELPIDAEVKSTLDSALADAERLGAQAVGVVLVTRDGRPVIYHSTQDRSTTLIGGLEVLKAQLIERLVFSEV